MPGDLTLTKLLTDFSDMGKLGLPTEKLADKFCDEMVDLFGLDKASVKISGLGRGNLLSVEELAVNMNKHYIDNNLSGFSEFPDLVSFSNLGYKSCAIFPLDVGGKAIGTMTLLSQKGDKFKEDILNSLAIASTLFAYQISNNMEREKNLNLAKYFDAAFDSQIPQCLIDKDGTVVKANKAMFLSLSMNAKELIGRRISEIFNIDGNIVRSMSLGLSAEIFMLSDSRKTFRISQRVINANLSHLLLFENTITKQLEERAKALDYSRFETLLMLDKEGVVTWVSANSGSVMKIEKGNLIGIRLPDIVVDKHFIDVLKGAEKEPYYGSVIIDMGNGIVLYTKMMLIGTGSGYMCLVYNSLQETYVNSIKDNLDRLVDLTSDMIIAVNEFGYVKSFNRKAENMLGYSNDDVSGKAISLFYSDQESQDSISKGMGVARENGIATNIHANMFVKDRKDPLPCECSIERVIDQDGNLSGYIIISRELGTSTERNELRMELEKKTEEAEKLKSESDLKTQFIYNISHDLKTPITNIKGFASLLYRGDFGEVSDEQKSYLEIIIKESERFTGLVQQILDVAKLESGKIKLDLQDVDFVMLGNNPSIDSLAKACEAKGLAFEWKVDGDVSTMKADPNRLIQVFVNLIGNAIKFTEKGGIYVHIYKKGKKVCADIRDTGIGISKEDQKRLFREFYQVHRKDLTMQQGSGTGLGLSIVKKIVNLHGGDVKVKSEPGEGSTFTVQLPLEGKKKQIRRQKTTNVASPNQ